MAASVRKTAEARAEASPAAGVRLRPAGGALRTGCRTAHPAGSSIHTRCNKCRSGNPARTAPPARVPPRAAAQRRLPPLRRVHSRPLLHPKPPAGPAGSRRGHTPPPRRHYAPHTPDIYVATSLIQNGAARAGWNRPPGRRITLRLVSSWPGLLPRAGRVKAGRWARSDPRSRSLRSSAGCAPFAPSGAERETSRNHGVRPRLRPQGHLQRRRGTH